LFSFLKGHAFLINILDIQNEIVGSSIFLQYGEFFHYHLSGRSLKSDNSINNYLLDKAIVYAMENGAKYFHFGGGRSTAGDDSLLKFKMNFSRDSCVFYIGKRIFNRDVYNTIIAQWERKNPEKSEEHKNLLLKYRY
jgi:lipid II:glycine glycyltransferase (peptidoglycan interpeptide bridge formation enzyme)